MNDRNSVPQQPNVHISYKNTFTDHGEAELDKAIKFKFPSYVIPREACSNISSQYYYCNSDWLDEGHAIVMNEYFYFHFGACKILGIRKIHLGDCCEG